MTGNSSRYTCPMKWRYVHCVLMLAALAGCADSATKPTEALDESTGVTVASMESPIELVREVGVAPMSDDHRVSFAYMGPVEWDRMGDITYALWIHIAPGNDGKVNDIHDPGAVSVGLDDGALELTPMDPPSVGREPYRAVASWGQTLYFGLTAANLKRLAASQQLKLNVRADNGSFVVFLPTHDTHATLTRYAISRGVTAD